MKAKMLGCVHHRQSGYGGKGLLARESFERSVGDRKLILGFAKRRACYEKLRMGVGFPDGVVIVKFVSRLRVA